MSDEQSTDESADSQQESEQQPADNDQPATQSDEQPAEQNDQSAEQSEEQPEESDQAADGSSKSESDSGQAVPQSESDDSSDKIEQPVDESGSTQVAMADTDGGVSMDAGTGGGDEIIISGSPFGGPYDPGFVNAEAAFASCIKVPDSLTLALVDVTDPAAPVFAGIRAEDTVFIASMAKIAALYAAFELRKRLQDAISGVPVATSVPEIGRAHV